MSLLCLVLFFGSALCCSLGSVARLTSTAAYCSHVSLLSSGPHNQSGFHLCLTICLQRREHYGLTGYTILQEITGIDVPTTALFDIQIKRIHEYKRQHLNMFSVINRYLEIKAMSPEERKKVSITQQLLSMCA